MKIKTKLTLGVGLLFLLILLLSLVGSIYINALKHDSRNILVDNYNSMLYSRMMLMNLENHHETAVHQFERNLIRQEKNTTETGEKDATDDVRRAFNRWKKHPNPVDAAEIREGIFRIMDMNMQAIQSKSEVAQNTANQATIWIVITGTCCFLIAFTLLINLPGSIANPIRELTASIRAIARENYSERVHFESHSEFGELARSFNTMASKLEEYNNSNLARLMMDKKRIETLINILHDPVIGMDEDGKILFANEEATRITGLPNEKLVGQSARELALRNDLIRTLLQDLLPDTVSATDKSKSIQIFANNKEGYFEKEILEIAFTPTGESGKQFAGHVIILKNVTEYKELDFAKTNFIATVSHEFKTPISSIKMSLQLLENKEIGNLNQEQHQLVESIQDDINRLLRITGELLNMTQVESGNIQLSILPSEAQEILTEAIHATRSKAEQKHIRFETDYPETLPKVLADSEKTTWVLTNLISNAVQYSHDDSVIYLTIREVEDQILFSVRDTGQGIAPQYKDKIFQRYFRVPGTKQEGTGLGLAISKEFVEAQGGQITVESDFGAGSTFTLVLNKANQA